ncbi:histidine phosphatase family protein [Robinsoniella peoriensis]
MPEIVLIRHSKTEGNLLGRYIGTTDEPLCEKGIQLLKQKKYPYVDRIYVSPMKRCIETAERIYPGLPCEIITDFRECSFGEFENKNYKELDGNPAYQAWIDSQGTLPFPGGESQETFRSRCRLAFQDTVDHIMANKISRAAVVVHGGTIMSIMEAFAVPKKAFYDWQVKNARGFLVTVNEADWRQRQEIRVMESI